MVNVCIAMARATIRLQRIQLPVSSETFYGTVFKKYGLCNDIIVNSGCFR